MRVSVFIFIVLAVFTSLCIFANPQQCLSANLQISACPQVIPNRDFEWELWCIQDEHGNNVPNTFRIRNKNTGQFLGRVGQTPKLESSYVFSSSK